MRNDIIIRPERPEEFAEIRQLVQRTFAEHTPYSDGVAEAELIEEIRASRYYQPELSFVALLDGKIVGHFMFSQFPLSPKPTGGYDPFAKPEFLMLAPVAVHADYCRQGIGQAMLHLGVELVKKLDYKGLTVEGNPQFYNRFGYRTSANYGIYATSGFPMNNPDCMMCQETTPGSLEGVHGYIVYDMYKNA